MSPARLDTDIGTPLLDMAANEIETMRNGKQDQIYHRFPAACLALLKTIEGNTRCIDCGDRNPEWAAVRYGALLCLQCSGVHRSLGVQVSCVRSVTMDEWSLTEVLSMLEGGNSQLLSFYTRHSLTPESCPSASEAPEKIINRETVTKMRYKTKAALFYRRQMEIHVVKILENGPYRGRHTSRKQQTSLTHRNTTLE